MVWGTFFGDEVPQSARLSAGEGVQKLFGQCPNAWVINLSGASLNLESKLSMLNFYQSISVDIPEVL